ncbi:MAG: hypothetical protein II695_07750 [Oscillospiraceae bacterium]|nr:hypothetical protein [Oscillospiraceae bacterium]
MERIVGIIHRVLIGAALLLMTGSLVFFLIRWGALPESPGVHFGPDGGFDVFDSKLYGFYPHIIGYLGIVPAVLTGVMIKKLRTGLHISEKGERLFRAEISITLDLIALIWSCYFAYWSYCVSVQQPQTDMNRGIFLTALLGAALLGTAVTAVTCAVTKTGEEKDIGQSHRIGTVITWVLTVGELFLFIWVWERIPGIEHPEQAGNFYCADMGIYLPKWILIALHCTFIAVLALMELLSQRAYKSGDALLTKTLDDVKVISAIFFFIVNILTISQADIGLPTVIFFAILYAVAAVKHIIKRKQAGSGQ